MVTGVGWKAKPKAACQNSNSYYTTGDCLLVLITEDTAEQPLFDTAALEASKIQVTNKNNN